MDVTKKAREAGELLFKECPAEYFDKKRDNLSYHANALAPGKVLTFIAAACNLPSSQNVDLIKSDDEVRIELCAYGCVTRVTTSGNAQSNKVSHQPFLSKKAAYHVPDE